MNFDRYLTEYVNKVCFETVRKIAMAKDILKAKSRDDYYKGYELKFTYIKNGYVRRVFYG